VLTNTFAQLSKETTEDPQIKGLKAMIADLQKELAEEKKKNAGLIAEVGDPSPYGILTTYEALIYVLVQLLFRLVKASTSLRKSKITRPSRKRTL